jgi:hypothetical protein
MTLEDMVDKRIGEHEDDLEKAAEKNPMPAAEEPIIEEHKGLLKRVRDFFFGPNIPKDGPK